MKGTQQIFADLFVLVMLFVFLLSGCGDDDDDSSGNGGDDTDDDDDDDDDNDTPPDDDDDDDTVPPYTCEEGRLLHGTNIWNDAIDFCMVPGEKAGSYTLKGGWTFLGGRVATRAETYETFDITITEDMLFSEEDPDVFEMDQDPWAGAYYDYQEDGAEFLLFLDGALGEYDDLVDRFWGITAEDDCADNYPPFIWGSLMVTMNCDTGAIIEWLPDNTVDVGQCYGIFFESSNPDCDWEGGQLFYVIEDEFVPALDPFVEDTAPPCAWYPDGEVWGVWWDTPAAVAGTAEYTFLVTDSCNDPSSGYTVEMNFVDAR